MCDPCCCDLLLFVGRCLLTDVACCLVCDVVVDCCLLSLFAVRCAVFVVGSLVVAACLFVCLLFVEWYFVLVIGSCLLCAGCCLMFVVR